MLHLVKKLFTSDFQPLNKVLISQSKFIENYKILNNLQPGVKVVPVLKSNAYGHGLVTLAKIIDQESPPLICVDSVYEAFLLQKANIKTEILVMGAIDQTRLQTKSLPFNLTLTDQRYLKLFEQYQPHAKIHLFIDTGMNREGVRMEDLEKVLKLLKESSLQLTGVMTHLAIANDQNHPLTRTQIGNFQKAKKMIKEDFGFSPRWWHIGGGDAISWANEGLCNLVRCGRLLYGVDAAGISALQPIMQLQTTVVQLKDVKKGESVGYFATYKAQKDIKTAVLPIGYNDGVDKRLSNKGIVKINQTQCPVIGLISMNMTVVDVSAVTSIKVGDKAVIYSDLPEEKNSIEKSAKLIDTNPSDLLVGMHPSTRREITN